MRRPHSATRWFLIAATAALLPVFVWTSIFKPEILAAVFLGAPVIFLLFWSLNCGIERALLAYLVVHVFADTLKRLVVIFGPEITVAQYVPLGVKLAFLIILGARGLARRVADRRMDGPDRALLVFLVLSVLGILVSGSLSITAKVLLFPFTVGPFLVYYAFREAVRVPGWQPRFLRNFAVLGLISAGYGAMQFVWGPTWIDKAWAEISHGFSIQAKNVHLAITTDTPLRPYSFFADHFSYGYFLVASLLAVLAGSWPRKSATRFLVVGFIAAALLAAMTRAAWTSVLMTVAVAGLLAVGGSLQRFLPHLVLGLYLILTLAINPLYETVFSSQSFVSAAERQLFSLGTLEARKDAAGAFAAAAQRYPILGDAGEASGTYFITAKLSGDLSEASDRHAVDDAHNFLVSLVVKAGLPGLVSFLVFLIFILGRSARSGGRSVWFVAGTCGLFLAGVAASGTFLSGFFLAWCAFSMPDRNPMPVEAEEPAPVMEPNLAGGVHG